MQPSHDPAREPSRDRLRRYGPLAVVLVLVVALVGASLLGGDDDGDDGDGAGTEAAAPATGDVPDGVVTWSMAKEQGLDVDWPETCDTETGRVAIPFFFRPECVAPSDGNGGATATGVTEDTVTVVAWLPNESDPVFEIVRQALGFDDTADEMRATYEGLAEAFGAYYETYGRTVELEFVQASGTMMDGVAARADAIKAASYEPFAVLGGPLLANTWSEELHARDVVCIACPGISDPAPSSYGIQPTTSQLREHVVNYVTTKLAGRPAEFAGDELKDDERVFAYLALAQNESDERSIERYEEDFAAEGIELAETVSFPLDPARSQELAVNAIAKMKAAGVTTVIVRADPITLPAFTREATKQGWYPEWVLGGYPFTDTTTFGRTFDQEQWRHAFGISFLPPAAPPTLNPAYQLHEWYHGSPPPADESLLLTYPQVALFFTGLQLAGPDLTVETFRDGAFAFPPTPQAVTQPSLDYGTEIWGRDDYGGIDDMVEFWYDPDATGVDETGVEGKGMIRYVDGGKRYYADQYTDELKVFDPEGAPTAITDPPPAEVPPEYPSPAGTG